MSWLSFAKGIGHSLFGAGDDPKEEVQKYLDEKNPGIEGLEVHVEGTKVVLKGNAKDSAAVEKGALLAGNLEGIEQVDVSSLTVSSDEKNSVGFSAFYTIESGDTLSAISKKLLGDANRYVDIFEANREVIGDPDLIFPGQKIRIPQA